MYWKQTKAKGHHIIMSEMNHQFFLNLKNGSTTLQFQGHVSLVTENVMEDYQHFKLQCIQGAN